MRITISFLTHFFKGKHHILLAIGTFSILTTSCINKSIMFKTDESLNMEVFEKSTETANQNYTIAPNDYIAISVFTNNGEMLVDPNGDFSGLIDSPNQARNNNQNMNRNNNNNNIQTIPLTRNGFDPVTYLVNADSTANLPMVGVIKLAGLTLREADQLLAEKYSEYYMEPYVVTQYLNKRVMVMGSFGDHIIPLKNEKMTLIEALTIAGGGGANANSRSRGSKDILASSIRLIRPGENNNFSNPSVQVVDLSTVDGLSKAHIFLESGDVIYIEPRRKMDTGTAQDLTVIISTVSSVLSILVLILSLTPSSN